MLKETLFVDEKQVASFVWDCIYKPKPLMGSGNKLEKETPQQQQAMKTNKQKKTDFDTLLCFRASMTHWSVKCIYATADKQTR